MAARLQGVGGRGGGFGGLDTGGGEEGVGASEAGVPFGAAGEEDEAGGFRPVLADGAHADGELHGDAWDVFLVEVGGRGGEEVGLEAGALAAFAGNGLAAGDIAEGLGDFVVLAKEAGHAGAVEVHMGGLLEPVLAFVSALDLLDEGLAPSDEAEFLVAEGLAKDFGGELGAGEAGVAGEAGGEFADGVGGLGDAALGFEGGALEEVPAFAEGAEEALDEAGGLGGAGRVCIDSEGGDGGGHEAEAFRKAGEVEPGDEVEGMGGCGAGGGAKAGCPVAGPVGEFAGALAAGLAGKGGEGAAGEGGEVEEGEEALGEFLLAADIEEDVLHFEVEDLGVEGVVEEDDVAMDEVVVGEGGAEFGVEGGKVLVGGEGVVELGEGLGEMDEEGELAVGEGDGLPGAAGHAGAANVEGLGRFEGPE